MSKKEKQKIEKEVSDFFSALGKRSWEARKEKLLGNKKVAKKTK